MTTLARALLTSTSNVVRCFGGTAVRSSMLLALLALTGCLKANSREFYEVNKDRERMKHGQPLKYHKDNLELSQHAMDLRMGVTAQKGKPSKADLYGEGSQFRNGIVPAAATAREGQGTGVYQAGGFYPAEGYPESGYPAGYPGAAPSGYAPGRTAMEYSGPDPTLK